MKAILDLFDLFTNTSKQLAGHLPQSGSDLIKMFGELLSIASRLNLWVANNIGIDMQSILMPIGKLIAIIFNFLTELLKQIVGRLK